MGTNKLQKYSKQTNQKQAKRMKIFHKEKYLSEREPLMATAGRI
jgi:hypothetical protein